jgi:NADH-quinone oxidoreductase subunit L
VPQAVAQFKKCKKLPAKQATFNMNNLQIVWLIPLLPLIGFLINGMFRKQLSQSASGLIGSGVILGSFILSVLVFLQVKAGNTAVLKLYDFINAGALTVGFQFQIDQLSALFLLIITGIGFLIHVYSTSYMHHEAPKDFAKYFAGNGRQFYHHVYWMGRRGSLFLFINWLLV